MVEREICMPLKALQAYNDREYTSDVFEEYYRKHLICQEKTEPSTPVTIELQKG